MNDPAYRAFSTGLTSPIIGGFAITPSDSVNLAQMTRQIRITGTAGNISVVWADGTTTVEPVAAGETLDWRVRRVNATDTTATGIRGYY